MNKIKICIIGEMVVMMKKNGFTLAEVLITLAIIGVVASLTLPALMTNTQEQQAITGYKKLINTLTEAGQMNASVDGFDYTSATNIGTTTDNFEESEDTTIGSIINSRLQIVQRGEIRIINEDGVDLSENYLDCAIFADSTAVCLPDSGFNDNGTTIIVDTNGKKGPNKLAFCDGGNCNKKENRHIYDQFFVTLRGGVAYPGEWTIQDVDGNQQFAIVDPTNNHYNAASEYATSGRR